MDPELGRYSGEGNGYTLQYSGLENSMDCIVNGVRKSRTGLSDFHFHFSPSGGSVVKNLPASARDMGSIPGPGTKFPHAAEQLSLHAATSEFTCPKVCALQREATTMRSPHNTTVPLIVTRESLCAATKSPSTKRKTQCRH